MSELPSGAELAFALGPTFETPICEEHGEHSHYRFATTVDGGVFATTDESTIVLCEECTTEYAQGKVGDSMTFSFDHALCFQVQYILRNSDVGDSRAVTSLGEGVVEDQAVYLADLGGQTDLPNWLYIRAGVYSLQGREINDEELSIAAFECEVQ